MKQRLVIAVLAVLCFAAGFGARMWTEDDGPAVPPPPSAPGAEFAAGSSAAKPEAKNKNRSSHSEQNRSKLASDIQRLRPQIDSYRAKTEEIDREFNTELIKLLTPEQRTKFEARQKRMAEQRAKNEAREAADTSPLTDEQIFQLQQRPLGNLLWVMSINERFEHLNKDLKFDETQRPAVKELYSQRREKFIALLDTITPPTIQLSQLAPRVQKITNEPKDPAKK